MGYPGNFFIRLAAMIGWLDIINLKPEIPDSITVYQDLVYKEVDSLQLKLDIYKSAALQKPAPVLIFIHGGAWRGGNKADYAPYLIDYAKKGYVTATIGYRLSKVAVYPAAVNDVKCAVLWIKQHAPMYMIDPGKIAVIGGSAGGHLSMMVGYTSERNDLLGPCKADSVDARVQAVVNLYGPCDLTTEFAQNNKVVHQFLGGVYDSIPDIYRQASPIFYITPDDPPTLIFHGSIDDTVPVSQSDTLRVRLNEAGVPNEYHRLRGWPHTMDIAVPVNRYCQYYMDRFFEKYIPR